MKLRREDKGNAEIDMTAFADMAFLLIIFFILTTTFIKPFGQELDIPSGTSDPAVKDQKQLTLCLKEREILYGEKADKIDMDTLRVRLAKEKLPERESDQRMVIVECAKNVPYEHYFQVVMAISDAGGVLALIEEEEKKK